MSSYHIDSELFQEYENIPRLLLKKKKRLNGKRNGPCLERKQISACSLEPATYGFVLSKGRVTGLFRYHHSSPPPVSR
ncbi:hypothetical protein TNCV_3341961 [Trichonephila clavipes]|nr:hypothetical protein TNCV_3341961 [Trichonephila clavipes]